MSFLDSYTCNLIHALALVCNIFQPLYYFFILWGGTKSLGTAATSGLLYKPQMLDEGDCGAIGGMKIGRGNRSTRRKPVPAPPCPPQNPHMTRPELEPGPPWWEASD
jgi:hypothetical protein